MSLATSRKLVMVSVEREGVMEAMVGGWWWWVVVFVVFVGSLVGRGGGRIYQVRWQGRVCCWDEFSLECGRRDTPI